MRTIYLLRHSITNYNNENRMLGITDIPLNEEGIKLAHKTKAEFLDKGIKGVVTSDLARTVETAKIISDFLNVPLYKSELLRERDHGMYEGMTLKEIDNLETKLSFTTKADGRETVRDFMNRAKRAFDNIINDISWDNFIIVSHNGMLKVFMSTYLLTTIHRWGPCEMRKVYYDDYMKRWSQDETNEKP